MSLKVFDVLGREVATLVNEKLGPGTYSAEWDASDASTGMYVYRLKAGNVVQAKKMILLR